MQNDDPKDNWPGARSAFAMMSSALPSTDFVRKLGAEIGRTAREKMGYGAGMSGAKMPFEDRVIDLRRLIRLLRQALVPVQPRQAFRTALGQQLQFDAIQAHIARQNRWRWLVIGSAVGSVLSLVGVLTALLLRQRQARPRAQKKTVGAT
jgi:ABC-type Fe3+-siderophore transport system permease subunit